MGQNEGKTKTKKQRKNKKINKNNPKII